MPWGRVLLRVLPLAAALICGSLARAEEPQQQLPRLLHTAWRQETGAPPNIWAIGQTPQGELWLGTGAGLYRFDGLRFSQFRSDGARTLPSEIITAMLVTRAGDVWVGYHAGGVSVIRDGKITNFTTGPPTGAMKQFVEGRDGAIWTAAFGGVAVFRDGRWTPIAWDPAYGRAFNLLVTRDGGVWVAAQYALLRIDPVSLKARKTNEPVEGSWALAEAPDGRLWFADQALGLRALDPARLFDPAPHARRPLAKADTLVSRRVMFDSAGVLWGAFEDDKGVFRLLRPDRVPTGRILSKADIDQTYGAAQGLTADLAAALFQDRERNVWVGSLLGLDRFSAADIVAERSIPSSTREGYRAVATPRGRLYLTDADTLYRLDDAGRAQALHRGLGHPNELCAGKDGQVWMAADRGFWRVDGPRLAPVLLPTGTERRVVLACAQDALGGLWVSISGAGLFRHDGQAWRPVTAQLPKGFYPRILVASADGTIWAADPGFDLYAISGGGVRRFTPADGLAIGELKTIVTDRGGLVLAGGERGIARLAGDRFQSLTVDRHPALSLVSGLSPDGLGGVWLGTIRGVSRISTQALDKAFADPAAPVELKRFDYRDGLPGAPQQHCCHRTVVVDGAHRVWLLTNRAAAWLDPSDLSHNAVPPTVTITGISANNAPLPPRQDMRLTSGVRDLRIDFAAPSLVAPDRVRVRYRLWGVDGDWVDPGARHQAFYTRLPPGHYRFSVIAANNDGVWNREGATLDFVIPPTFVQSRLFLALVALGLALLTGGAFYLRHRLTARRITQQYEDRMAERERIARELHDTLLQNVQALTLKFHSLTGVLPEGPARGQVAEAIDRAEQVVVESRERIMDLRTARSSEDLAQRLSIAAEFTGATAKPELKVTTLGETRQLTPTALDEVTQIGSEAIRNAVRHSGASLVTVEIAFEPEAFRLMVRDDGVGIAAGRLVSAEQAGHYGVVGMRERAQRLGGDLRIEGDAGTRIELTLPARQAYGERRWLTELLLKIRPVRP